MTLVVDASVVTSMVLGRLSSNLWRHLESDGRWAAPEHLVVEAAQALRGHWLGHKLTAEAFAISLRRLAGIEVASFPVRLLLPRMMQLASNATACDAAYVALAERLDSPLLTLDQRLAKTPGARCSFVN